jgi:ParB family chromosome partitioning protein
VPALIKALSDKEALEYSLIENIQRENLNPMEEAKGYQRLIDEFGYTQEAVAEAVGKERATVANLLRLLKLPEEIQRAVEQSVITLGHAKVLLSVENRQKQLALFARTAKEKLSVRQLEWLVQPGGPTRERRAQSTNGIADAQTNALEKSLREALGTKVALNARGTRGKIVIEYFSHEDLTRICAILGVSA